MRTNDATSSKKLLPNFGPWSRFTIPTFYQVRIIIFLWFSRILKSFFRASISSYGGSYKNNSGSSARTRGYHGKNVQVITIQDKETLQRFANATASNVTYLLDHLLQQYDNSLRPDISGTKHKILTGNLAWNWYLSLTRSSFGGGNQYAGAKHGTHFWGRHGKLTIKSFEDLCCLKMTFSPSPLKHSGTTTSRWNGWLLLKSSSNQTFFIIFCRAFTLKLFRNASMHLRCCESLYTILICTVHTHNRSYCLLFCAFSFLEESLEFN